MAPRAQVVILIGVPERHGDSDAEELAAAFGLSAAEARVAALAAAAVSTGQIAERLGVSVNTVKTHLKTVYSKAGARSRAEFVRLVLARRAL